MISILSHAISCCREVLTPSSKKYTKRSNRSEVVMNHGDTKSVSSWSGVREEEPVKIELSPSSAGEKYRYMFQKLQDRAHGGWPLLNHIY